MQRSAITCTVSRALTFATLPGGNFFGTKDSEGEATVNSNIKTKYQAIQRKLSEQGFCQRDDSIEALWRSTNQILSQMYVPLVQMLIHSMKQDDQAPKVRMYALAVVPQLSRCRPSLHAKLKDYLLDQEYDKRDFGRILDLLQQAYDCLGVTCADVGAYRAGTDRAVAECAGYEETHPLAGFVPRMGVRAVSYARPRAAPRAARRRSPVVSGVPVVQDRFGHSRHRTAVAVSLDDQE